MSIDMEKIKFELNFKRVLTKESVNDIIHLVNYD